MNHKNRKQQEVVVRKLIREVLIQEGFFDDVWSGIKMGVGAAYDAAASTIGVQKKPESGFFKTLDDLHVDDHPYKMFGDQEDDHDDEEEDFSERATTVNISGVTESDGVVWNDVTERFVRRLRQVLDPAIPLHITSAVRTPETQAGAMIKKYNIGGAEEIRKIYGKKSEYFLSQPATESSWAGVVRDLIDKGILPSRHLKGDAVDIRTRNLSSGEIDALIAAAIKAGAGKTLLETRPPHLHIDRISEPMGFANA